MAPHSQFWQRFRPALPRRVQFEVQARLELLATLSRGRLVLT